MKVALPDVARPYACLSPTDGARSLVALDRQLLLRLYSTHGAILARGFDASLDAFRTVASWFSRRSIFNDSLNRTLVDAAQNIQTVDRGEHAFPLHPELARKPWMPDVCFFHCLTAPGSGGETLICDGVRIVEELPAELRESLSERRLRYDHLATADECSYWLNTPHPSEEDLARPRPECPYRFYAHEDGVACSFTRPFFHRPMFSEKPAFGSFLLFSRYCLLNPRFPTFEDGEAVPQSIVAAIKSVADGLTAPIAWQPGDLLILDNTRFMHGRNRVHSAAEREILTYFGYLDFAPPNSEEPARPVWRHMDFNPPGRAV